MCDYKIRNDFEFMYKIFYCVIENEHIEKI